MKRRNFEISATIELWQDSGLTPIEALEALGCLGPFFAPSWRDVRITMLKKAARWKPWRYD